jgi:GNAT superfamily N-acetyltransferase/ketosteroid isomerase-like protein
VPSERLEVVRRLRDAWCRFVPDEIVAFYSLDAEIVSPTGEMFGQVYRGHEGLRRYLSEFAAAFEAPSFEVEDLIDAGACVVEIGQVSARGRHSGAEARRRIASLYSLRAGLVFKHVIYLDRAEALAAAGLPPRPTRRPPSGPTETAHEGRTSSDAHDGPDRLPITTRRAGAGDAARLVATVTEAFERYRAWAPPGWQPPSQSAEATDLLAEALSRPDVWCLVAESQSAPVGHVALSPTTIVQPEPAPAGTVNLWQLFVRPAWQGRGVGRCLMRSALGEAHRRGFARLRLWTPRGAARSRRFYERAGWTPTGNERDESPIGLPIVEYERASWQPNPQPKLANATTPEPGRAIGCGVPMIGASTVLRI